MAAYDFKDQVVLITGAAGGLGTALMKAFYDFGAKVYASDINQIDEEISSQFHGNRFQSELVDVRVPAQISKWVNGVVEKEGRIDVLVAAAGYCPLVSIPDLDESTWDHIVDVNLKGTFFSCQAVYGQMMSQGYGRIVNISSVGAHTGGAIAPAAYAAAKAGIITLTKSFAVALSPHGVMVNVVAPGPFDTVMIKDFPADTMEKIKQSTPDRRVGLPEDVVAAVLFLADKGTTHITGANLDVNGGLYLR